MSFLGSSKTASTTQTVTDDHRTTDAKVSAQDSKIITNAGGTVKGDLQDLSGSIGGGKGSRVELTTVTDFDSVKVGADIARNALDTVAASSREIGALGRASVDSIAAAAAGQQIPNASAGLAGLRPFALPLTLVVVVAGVGLFVYMRGKRG